MEDNAPGMRDPPGQGRPQHPPLQWDRIVVFRGAARARPVPV